MPNFQTEQLLLLHYIKNIMRLASKEWRVETSDFHKPEYAAIYKALKTILATGKTISNNGQVTSPSDKDLIMCIAEHNYIPGFEIKN